MKRTVLGGLTLVDFARFAAGLLIILVGVFVLTAKPGSWLHRLFFVLAIMDGMSTILFGLALLSIEKVQQHYFIGVYYYHLLAFIALLAIFGFVFPKPLANAWTTRLAVGGVLSLTVIALFVYAVDHRAFWVPAPGRVPAQPAPIGTFVNTAWNLITALLVLRLTHGLARERSDSHRRQGAYVLGGMALAYLPGPLTFLAQGLATFGLAPWVSGRWDRIFVYHSYLAATLALIASIVLLARAKLAPEARDERRFVMGCYVGVGVLATVALLQPGELVGIALRSLPLLAYPVLLGYAIARYEVFDIDRQLRRAATVTLAAAGLTVAFILAESTLENVIASSLFGGLPSTAVSGALAAVITAVAFLPVARASRKAASKLVPELSHDELYQRKREIYLHSLAGAMADGILKEGESRTLAVLRESLGITDAEHRALLHQVQASA